MVSRTMSATVGWLARRNDSELPQQSWNSSQTRIGFASCSIAAAMARVAASGSPRTAAIDAQNPMNSRREMPRSLSSCETLLPIIVVPRRQNLKSDRLYAPLITYAPRPFNASGLLNFFVSKGDLSQMPDFAACARLSRLRTRLAPRGGEDDMRL